MAVGKALVRMELRMVLENGQPVEKGPPVLQGPVEAFRFLKWKCFMWGNWREVGMSGNEP